MSAICGLCGEIILSQRIQKVKPDTKKTQARKPGFFLDTPKILQSIHYGCFLVLWADSDLACMNLRFVISLVVFDTQLSSNLSYVLVVNLEAILIFDICLDVAV